MYGTAAAASGRSTVRRTNSEPARASSLIWIAVSITLAVSVLVIDCTTTGASPPTQILRWPCVTSTLRLARRFNGPEGMAICVEDMIVFTRLFGCCFNRLLIAYLLLIYCLFIAYLSLIYRLLRGVGPRRHRRLHLLHADARNRPALHRRQRQRYAAQCCFHAARFAHHQRAWLLDVK